MENDFLLLNIKEFLANKEIGEDVLKQIFSSFSCELNKNVEKFLLDSSIEFAKKNQSVTYIVLNSTQNNILGYFTIAIKPITIQADGFSNTFKRKIARVSEKDPSNDTYSLSAYLIAQLGKNYENDMNKFISGEQLLNLATSKIKELQYMVGGMVVFLEAECNDKLLKFYEENGFRQFNIREKNSDTEDSHNLIQMLKVL